MPKSIDVLNGLKTLPEKIPFNHTQRIGSDITLNVCQGIGDIFWVYQKFAPYFDNIQFRLSIINKNETEQRSVEWVKVFPKAHFAGFNLVSVEGYDALVEHYSSMKQSIVNWEKGDKIDYCNNKWLESGIHLDEIDPGSLVRWDVPLLTDPSPLGLNEYIVLYVSGGIMDENMQRDEKTSLWSVEKWGRYIDRIYQKYGLSLPIVMIGAKFDEPAVMAVEKHLKEKGYTIHIFLQQPPSLVLGILKKCKLFIGYQSGLNILADNMDVRQIMLYFPMVKGLVETWRKPRNAGTLYHYAIFSSTPEEVAEIELFNYS